MQQVVEKLTARAARDFKLPSISVGVYHQGKEYYYSLGRIGSFGQKADADTVYPIASASKAFIAAAVMMLAEADKLDLDAPVTTYLPDFKMYTPKRTAELTMRDGLCHRSGLPRHDITLFTNQQTSLRDMVAKIQYLEPAWPARTRFCYQNHMFGLASLLVEQVAGMPWGDFVRQRIFAPLGMTRSHTRYLAYTDVDNNYARPRIGVMGFNLPGKMMDPDSTGCAGAISTSVRDLLQWAKTNLNKGAYSDTGRLFSEQSANELHGRQMPIQPGEMSPYAIEEVTGQYYGLGWFVEQYRDVPVVHHGGTLFGFKSIVGFIPGRDFACAILVNKDSSQAPSALCYSLFNTVLGLDDIDWNARFTGLFAQRVADAKSKYKAAVAPPAQKPRVDGCAGNYHNPAYGTFGVEEKGGKLLMRNLGTKLTFYPSTQDEYALASPLMGVAFPCRFRRESDAVTGLDVKLEPDLDSYIPFARVEKAVEHK